LEHGGALWISDINPRVGTSSVFSLGAGVDLVGHWLGERAQRPAARPLTMVRVLEERWFLDLRGLGLRGVVFDVDDTLVDQRRWMFHKMRLAGQRLGVEDEARWREQALMLLEDNEKARFVDEMARAFGWGEARRVALLEAFREALPEASDVEYSDVKPALEALRAAGFVLATLTDARRAPHAQKMARLGLDGLWAAEVCAGELGAAKPDGRVFEAAARALELPASSLLMVGDHLGRDVLGAARAGYGAACHLQREGGFHRGHAGLGGWWPAPSAPLAQARSLTEVAWMLGVGR
jgi:FMN phosphatase YigB (HAD superfamily)